MKVLVTAGSTMVPIDQVRAIKKTLATGVVSPEVEQDVITNIFRGRTGAAIADHFAMMGCDVTLLTSDTSFSLIPDLVQVISFKTFDQLLSIMGRLIIDGRFDIIIHSPAISDYRGEGVFVLTDLGELIEVPSSGKVPSNYKRLFLELVPTIKIIDLVKKSWGFRGELVKFKLQVAMSDQGLQEVAAKSMVDSGADHMVANCLEWSSCYAYVLSANGEASKRVARSELPKELFRRLVK